MDAMKKSAKPDSFRRQTADAMRELRSIMTAGSSPTADGRLSIRTIEVAEPSFYDAKTVKKVRSALNVSQSVFAKLLGVSNVLVRSWERGARQPAPIACRLLDQIRDHPSRFAELVVTRSNGNGTASIRTRRRPRNVRRAA
jgi:putative transcriptional regulator